MAGRGRAGGRGAGQAAGRGGRPLHPQLHGAAWRGELGRAARQSRRPRPQHQPHHLAHPGRGEAEGRGQVNISNSSTAKTAGKCISCPAGQELRGAKQPGQGRQPGLPALHRPHLHQRVRPPPPRRCNPLLYDQTQVLHLLSCHLNENDKNINCSALACRYERAMLATERRMRELGLVDPLSVLALDEWEIERERVVINRSRNILSEMYRLSKKIISE